MISEGVLYKYLANGKLQLQSYPVNSDRTSYKVVEGTVRIDAYSFYSSSIKLTEITFPYSLESIGDCAENWADFSAAAKEKLVGKTAKIVVPFKNEETGFYEFKPLVVDGKEVVRPLTAEDVDTIGKACLFNSVNI